MNYLKIYNRRKYVSFKKNRKKFIGVLEIFLVIFSHFGHVSKLAEYNITNCLY